MFSSVLVANRGEIACRIFRTARAMGIATAAVYSDADAKAKHVRQADKAVRLGPAPASQSYLRGDLIIAAAKDMGAKAIHPGYGFLSENPDFAEAVIAAGLIWIGPTPRAIRAMGLKDEAKRIAIEAGVPVLEGYQGEDQSEKRLLRAAKEIGFPVLIKAVAGGGGRGIREVTRAEDFKDQLASAQREAKAAFGNDVVLVEKLVSRPRHIEVQVFGDKHGQVVHLFERDCSLQRRRQKVIEEAPAPGMTDEVRAAMTQAAVKLARAVAYENAGTVEFIVAGEGPLRPDGFWFLEMNTRLQVEHPVTEMITGQDLVEWQFRVAAGESLPRRQEDLAITGHAIEARICAEDPAEGFRPSVGRIEAMDLRGSGERVDAGFDQGDVVPSAYDSLLAKLIVSACNREDAVGALVESLDQSLIAGIRTNAGFLRRCANDAAFAAGQVHTGLIADGGQVLTHAPAGLRSRAARKALRACVGEGDGQSPWASTDGWRLNAPARRSALLEDDAGRVRAEIGGPDEEDPWFSPAVPLAGGRIAVALEGETFVFAPAGAGAAHSDVAAGDEVKAPLPGKIVAVSAKAGQAVTRGEPMITLEAMKMEHALKAPRDGVVAEVNASEGDQVKEGAVLIRLLPE